MPKRSQMEDASTQPESKDLLAFWFFHHAEQFYAVTRFSYFGTLIDVTLVNAHHTIEYLLKAILIRKHDLLALKNIRHNLTKLWQKYREIDNSNPTRDEYIEYFNRYDILRYPNDEGFHRIAWGWPMKEFLDFAESDAMKQHAACFNLNDFDEIVYYLRRAYFEGDEQKTRTAHIVVSNTAREMLYRENLFMSKENVADIATSPAS